MKPRLPHILLLAAVWVWFTAILLPSLFMSVPAFAPAGELLYRAFSLICHQYDSRSLFIAGQKLAVCSRCSAIYFGFAIGATAWCVYGGSNSKNRRANHQFHPGLHWLIGVLPMVVDVLLDTIKIYPSSFTSRVLTGLFFGLVASAILFPHLVEAISEIRTIAFRKSAYE